MANFNYNKITIAGRLTADPELKQTPNGVSVTSFTVAVNRRYSKPGEANSADFLPVVAWRQQAELIAKYFRKGSSICVSGSLQSRNWTDTQGNKRYSYDIVVEEVYFVDSKSENTHAPSAADFGEPPPAAPAYSSQPSEPVNFEEIQDDDDLPF